MARRLTFHLIPHTHWDREWYLTRARFQVRLVAAIGELLELFERDPAARFLLDGQTVVIEDALAIRPEWDLPIARAVHGGRLDTGPWYVLADELIPAGESLLHNLLEGARDSAMLGRRMDVLYSPDAFGHPAQLPALAAEFGIGAAVVWRGLGPSGAGDPDLLRWIAPGGASVLLYHLPRSGYEVGVDLLQHRGLQSRWPAVRDAAMARAMTDHVAIFVGADHHGPPANLSELVARLRRIERRHRIRASTLTEYFAAVASRAPDVPVVTGELRWSYGHTWTLQGVHATRPRIKRQHGTAERLLVRMTEPLAALATLRDGSDRRPLLRSAWRTLLQSQFHDTLAGCTSDAVAREQAVRLHAVTGVAREVARDALFAIAGHDADRARAASPSAAPALLLWNPVPRRRGGVMTAELTFFRHDVLVGPPGSRKARTGPGVQPFALSDSDGRTVPVQILGVRRGHERVDAPHHYPDQDAVDRVQIAFKAPAVDGLALRPLAPAASSVTPRGTTLVPRAGTLQNRFVTVHIGPTGTVRLDDRRAGVRYSGLCRLEDEWDRGDSYTPFIPPDAPVNRSGEPRSRRTLATGPLFGAIEARWSMRSSGEGTVECRMVAMVHADSAIVRVRLELDHRAMNHRLRARFPIGIGEAAIAGAAFGFERRDPVRAAADEFPAETPVATAPGQRFVAATTGGRGLALLLPGFFEYEWTARGDVVLTLLRAIGELSRGDLPTRPGHAGWPMATPEAQEPGHHAIEFALAPVGEVERANPDRLEQLWEDAFLPIDPTFLRHCTGGAANPPSPGIALAGPGLVFSALKPAESGEGIVVRCYNTADHDVAGAWTVHGASVARAALLRGDEATLAVLPVRGGTRIPFLAGPRQLVTIQLLFDGWPT